MVDVFQFGRMNREATMVDQAILIFSKAGDEGLQILGPRFQHQVDERHLSVRIDRDVCHFYPYKLKEGSHIYGRHGINLLWDEE